MNAIGILFICVGGASGAILRFFLGILFNPIFPSIPMGTLAANLLGGFLMGIVMAVTKGHLFFSEEARLGITTGFLGGLTTFSTFSAETVTLLSYREFPMFAAIIVCHVAGTILATIFGIYTVKLLTS